MRKIIAMLSVSVVFLMLVSSSVSAIAPAPSPGWVKGDWWKYKIDIIGRNYTVQMIGRIDITSSGSGWTNITDITTRKVNNTDYNVFEEKISAGGTSTIHTGMGQFYGTFTLEGYTWRCLDNYSTVEELSWMNITLSGLPPLGGTFSSRNYTPPDNFFNFPLDSIHQWWSNTTCSSVLTALGNTEKHTGSLNNSYNCLREQTISVPKDNFTAFIVNRTSPGSLNSTEYAYAPLAGNYITRNETMGNLTSWSRTAFALEDYYLVVVPEPNALVVPMMALGTVAAVAIARRDKKQ